MPGEGLPDIAADVNGGFAAGPFIKEKLNFMLQIKNISKEYRTGDLVQKALDHVSLDLRDSEFVAVLGPSGSGKTTLLNIVGGLDRYDSGDLVINGISTKKYRDRDWDSYRNHTIGFVFQSYNLIMHQSVLANVELALSISGVSGNERRVRSMEALRRVGLAGQEHKKPSQLSGGQMQRVAIARALVNDPDIVLADEPTGALDTETSVQVMDILKEVARDRLVVMVTHNPDLAKKYATRIVTIKDGRILSDTNPPDTGREEEPPVHRNMGKAAMSFLTALTLSGNNLRTKKARTLLVSFAGSIGIIGIALILALSSGANRFIQTQEAETLAMYPLQIEKTGYDLTSMMKSMGDDPGSMFGSDGTKTYTDAVGVDETAGRLLKDVSTNDLGALKSYLDSRESGIQKYVNAIEYNYGITPQIYTLEDGTAEQLNPNHLFDSLSSDDSGNMDIAGMMTGSLSVNLFSKLPTSKELYQESYDLKAGHWPEKDTDLTLVLNSSGEVSDVILYAMGLRDRKELEQRIENFADGKKDDTKAVVRETSDSGAEDRSGTEDGSGSVVSSGSDRAVQDGSTESAESVYAYDDFLGKSFRLVNACDYYTRDDTYNVWTDQSGDRDFVKKLAENGKKLTITGIVQPKKETMSEALSTGIAYSPLLEEELMKAAAQSEVVKDQLKNPEVNVLTGKKFSEENASSDLDLSKLFSIDGDALQKAFSSKAESISPDSLDLNKILQNLNLQNLDFGNLNLEESLDPSAMQKAMPDLGSVDLAGLLSRVQVHVTGEQLQSLFQEAAKGYLESISKDPSTDYTKLGSAFVEYLQSETGRAAVQSEMQKILDANKENFITRDDVVQMASEIFDGYSEYAQKNLPDDPLSPDGFRSWLSSPDAEETVAKAFSVITDKLSRFTVTDGEAASMTETLSKSYDEWAGEHDAPQLSKAADSFAAYLQSEDAQKLLLNAAGQMIDVSGLQSALSDTLQSTVSALIQAVTAQIEGAITSAMTQMTGQLQQALSQALGQTVSAISGNMEKMFQIDPDQLASAFRANMDAGQLQKLMSSMMQGNSSSLENNLSSLGYADPAEPSEINIYPKDFKAKNEVVNLLTSYNKQMEKKGEDSKVITYTDMVTAMMLSVTKIIDTISYVLIAFVAISLVVSSIMIGVITYISVLERRKEIGILRAMGASRHNVAQVFNAETFITGILAGGIGVGVTLLLTIPINALIVHVTGQEIHAALPPAAALMLIALSVALTMFAGLIPSRKASKSDPVTALRS